MALSLHDQVAKKCIHFSGIMDTTCRAGIAYDDVKDASVKPYRFPCLQQGGSCAKAEFLTEAQVVKRLQDLGYAFIKNMHALFRIRKFLETNKVSEGKIPCNCGGTIRFTVAQSNGHIWCKCNRCDISFNE